MSFAELHNEANRFARAAIVHRRSGRATAAMIANDRARQMRDIASILIREVTSDGN